MSVVLLIAMFTYDVLLTLVVLLLALLHGALARFLNAFREVRSQTMRREQGLLLGVGMQMLNHADNLRMTGSDDRFFSRWSGQQASELRARQLYSELGSINSALPGLVAAFRAAAVLGFGGSLVMAGEMTLGDAGRVLHPGGDVPGAGRAFSRVRRKTPGARNRPAKAGGHLQHRRRPRVQPAEARKRSQYPRSTAGSSLPAISNCATSPSVTTRAGRP